MRITFVGVDGDRADTIDTTGDIPTAIAILEKYQVNFRGLGIVADENRSMHILIYEQVGHVIVSTIRENFTDGTGIINATEMTSSLEGILQSVEAHIAAQAVKYQAPTHAFHRFTTNQEALWYMRIYRPDEQTDA